MYVYIYIYIYIKFYTYIHIYICIFQCKGKLTKAKEEMVECSGGMTTNEINKKMSVWVREVIDAAKGTMPLTSHAVNPLNY